MYDAWFIHFTTATDIHDFSTFSFRSYVLQPNYGTYSDLEAHAELCYAEALLLQAALTIMEGEDLTGLIKGTIKIKNCYNSYK